MGNGIWGEGVNGGAVLGGGGRLHLQFFLFYTITINTVSKRNYSFYAFHKMFTSNNRISRFDRVYLKAPDIHCL